MNIYLDIETLPTVDQEIIDSLAVTITAPGQYKKPESIAEWLKDNKESATKELVSRTSFDGLYGSIACICWAFDDEEVDGVSVCGNSESEMLGIFYQVVRERVKVDYHGGNTSSGITVIGHNVAGFDLPFMKHRSIIHGIRPQPDIRKAMSAEGQDIWRRA